MDFWDATRVLARRWYLTVPLLLMTFAATGYTATAIKADYVLTSYVQLIPSQTTLTVEEARRYPVNPWKELGLEAMSQAANYATVDHTFLEWLKTVGYSTNLKITSGDPLAGATIEVVGKSRQQVVQTTDAIVKRYEDATRQLQVQYRVRPQDMITVQRLDQGQNLERPGGKVKRAIIAVFGTGILLTAGLVIGLDAVLRRRRMRAAPAADADETSGTGPVTGTAVLPGFNSSTTTREQGSETVRTRTDGAVPPETRDSQLAGRPTRP